MPDPQPSSETSPRVFISYSWDSEEHKDRVLALAQRLRADKVDAWIDRFTPFPPQTWARWMDDEIERAKFVVVIVTEKYAARATGRTPAGTGLGANWEGAIITQYLYRSGSLNVKYLPAIFVSEDADHLPRFLDQYSHFQVGDDAGYNELYRHLTGQPAIVPVPLGTRRDLPPVSAAAPLPVPTVHPVASMGLDQLPPCPKLVGRDEKLAEIAGIILGGGVSGAAVSGQNASLQGMGGVGKTALAVALAHRLKSHWPAAQLFLSLRGADPDGLPPVPPSQLMETIIRALRPELQQLPAEPDKFAQIYGKTLKDAGKVLLLLDDAANADQVRPLWPPDNCLLLVTSRVQIGLDDLSLFDLECLAPGQAQEMLLKFSARPPQPSRLGALASDAARLCGCLPIALQTFARLVRDETTFQPDELVARLRTGRGQWADKVNRVFKVSYDLLPERLRERWALLSIFGASFRHDAAAALWNEEDEDAARDDLQSLVSRTLVEFNADAGRFRLHDLMRQFCAGKLPPEEAQAVHLRHAKHYAAVAEKADALYNQGGGSVRQGLDLFDAERAHLDAAFDWLATCSDNDAAGVLLSLVNAVVYAGDLRFHPRERIRWLMAQRKGAGLTGDRLAEGNALGNLGLAYAALGEPRQAIDFYEQNRVIAREIGDRRGEGNALGNLGLAYAALGETRQAIDFYGQYLVIAREIGDRRGEGNALGNLGNAYAALGETRKAVEFHEQALIIDREIGDRRGEGADLGNLGNAYADLGEPRKAIDFYEQALVIDREIGDRRGEGADLGNLGIAYAALGETRQAIDFYERRLVIAREIGDRRGEGNASWNSAGEFWKLGEHAETIIRAEAALAIYEAIEDPFAAKVRAALARWRSDGV